MDTSGISLRSPKAPNGLGVARAPNPISARSAGTHPTPQARLRSDFGNDLPLVIAARSLPAINAKGSTLSDFTSGDFSCGYVYVK